MLPIGSIVYLKKGIAKTMIMNRGSIIKIENEEQIFDYSGCVYPVGFMADNIYYFNEADIDKVVFEGYTDSEEERFQEIYKDWKEKRKNLIEIENEESTVKKELF